MRISAWMVAIVVACGGGSGGSGVPGDKLFVDLTADELQAICEHVSPLVDPRTVSCPTGGDQVVDAYTVAECLVDLGDEQESLATCGLTAGEVEDCLEAIATRSDAEVCDDESIPPACVPLFSCA